MSSTQGVCAKALEGMNASPTKAEAKKKARMASA